VFVHARAHKHTDTVKEAIKLKKKEDEEKAAAAAAKLRNYIERGGRNTGPVSPATRTSAGNAVSYQCTRL
jgi:hypothetical protein